MSKSIKMVKTPNVVGKRGHEPIQPTSPPRHNDVDPKAQANTHVGSKCGHNFGAV